MSMTTVILAFDRDDVRVVAGLEVSYTPGCPGRYSGPPEACYPPEAVQVDSIKIEHWLVVEWLDCDGEIVRELDNSTTAEELEALGERLVKTLTSDEHAQIVEKVEGQLADAVLDAACERAAKYFSMDY